MYVKELIVEGFKSYAARTVISGWDREFNAITGLNGSGKSNILDAICFVLGITNLSQVRAQNLQDLVYKRGQAGIQKASVSIVFDNTDRGASPIGYEQYPEIVVTRQIIIGGKNKWLINGHNAQQNAVINLFQSVQLNVNNPHFLIMQGKITKVLNMKPQEILAMIEEAAGTRMYEEKKEKALRTIMKKEKKVEEITQLLNEEITPKLNRLRQERDAFLDFQKTETDMQRMERLVVASEFSHAEAKLNNSDGILAEKKSKLDEFQAQIKAVQNEIEEIESELNRISAKKDEDMSKGGKFQELELQVKELSKDLVKLKTQTDLKSASINEEQKNLNQIRSNKLEATQQLGALKTRQVSLQEEYQSIKSKHDEQAEEVRKRTELLHTLTTGLGSEEGHENGYMDQLQGAKNDIASANTTIEQAKVKISHLKKELSTLEPKLRKAENQNKAVLAEMEKCEADIRRYETELSKCQFDPEKESTLRREKSALQDDLQRHQEAFESMRSQLASLNFQYSDPVPNFDRAKVKGLVAELIHLDEENHHCSTALEICAGGRLYNVVVEDEITGSQLLKNGKLKKRVTIIPLNKIKAFKTNAQKIATAQRLAPGKVNLALSLVGYEGEVSAAMEYVFGNTFICSDSEAAQKVTFHPDIRTKSVTYLGDVYDPSGTLSGGSKPNTSGILVKLQTYNELNSKIKGSVEKIRKIDEILSTMQNVSKQYKQLQDSLNLKIHQRGLIEQRMNGSEYAKLAQHVEEVKISIEKELAISEKAKSTIKIARRQIEEIEREMSEFKNSREDKLKEIQVTLAKAKAALSQSALSVKKFQREVRTVELEIEQLETDISNLAGQEKTAETLVSSLFDEEREMKSKLLNLKDTYDEAQKQLDAEKALLSSFDNDLKQLEKDRKAKKSEVTNIELSFKKLSHEVDRLHKDKETASQAVKNLIAKHSWIEEQKINFGKAGTQYDFSNLDVKEASNRLKQLQEKHNTMRKKVNTKVMDMIDLAEKQENSLKQKLVTVKKDKSKIEETIHELDKETERALEKTWKKVNSDFGAIFGELLPGNTAKLEPLDGKPIMDGLEVKVCLGKVWKESLTELSGGQRSLIALSLILSLLQFKPAPMYILDEIDAALDLSHTQNIGQLFRTRFKGSQFIVVSLKEGMFQNANVLFRARFRDGTSTVERIAKVKSKVMDKENIQGSASKTKAMTRAKGSTLSARS